MALTVTKHFGLVGAVATPTEVTITLDPTYMYEVHHTGIGVDGTDDANSAIDIFLSETTGFTASHAEADDKMVLRDGQTITIGPGIKTLYMKPLINGDGAVSFSRIDQTTRVW